ncbi:major facilitator superfamily domain-containing protein [Aspergillus pseudoustus]|uniref:Major facilitator superfamily domain-containing protein n=1 Tax=Aspergillus pseudoustus TaxID=1810923 RepID=A0ABR4JPP5_9EURO
MSADTKTLESTQDVEKKAKPEHCEISPASHPDQDNDALNIISAYTGDREWTPDEERRLVRKIDLKMMSLLALSYGLQYYDKALLGQAAIFGLRDDLHLNIGNRYSFSAAIFYLGFVVGGTPAVILAQRYPVERVLFSIVCLWGVCLLCTIACHNYQGLYAQRFVLGMLEAGVSPMFMLSVGAFYKRGEQDFRMGIWYSATGFVAVFSPLINYALGHITSGPLSPWQYMYIVAGAITILWSFVLLFYFPPDPVNARILTERERYIAIARLQTNNYGVRNTHFKPEHVWELVLDPKFWLLFSIAFLGMIPNGPGSTFIPIIINGFGFSTLNSLLLNMPYSFIAGMSNLCFPYLAYKTKNTRTIIMAGGYAMTIISSLLFWLLPRSQKGALLFACYIFPFWGASFALTMSLSTTNTAGYTKRSLASSGLFLGYCLGNFVGPLLFKSQDAPSYDSGFISVIACSAAACLLSLAYRYVCVWENRRRDKSGVIEAFDHAFDDDSTDGKNKQFRYAY